MLIRKYITWPLCLLFVTGLAFGSHGSVLCISDDGHIIVESVCQPRYGEKTDCCFSATSANVDDHQNDGDDCLDLSLGGSTWLRKNFGSVYSPLHIASMSSLSVSSCFDNNSSKYSRFAVADSFRGQDRLALLISTTVLIC